MFKIFIFIFFIYSSVTLNASSSYIKIDSILEESHVLDIKNLSSLFKVKIFKAYDGKEYIYYLGPYKGPKVDRDLKHVKQKFPQALIIVTKFKTVESKEKVLLSDKNRIFIGTALSYNMVELNNYNYYDYNYNLELGYAFKNGVSLSVEYSKSFDASLTNYYLSANYDINANSKMTPYVGTLVGYSQLNWKNLIDSSLNTLDTKSSSLLIGLEGGVKYKLYSNIHIYGSYVLYYTDHISAIDDFKDEYNYLHNFQLGIHFLF